MSKIPVGATIAQTYRFAFRDFFKILSIVWLPLVILSVLGLPLLGSMSTLSQNIATGNFPNPGKLMLLLIPLYLLGFYFIFMQIAGILQQALGLRTGSPYYYLTLGKPVWRLIGAFILTMLIVIGLYLLYMLAAVVLGAGLAFAAKSLHIGRGAGLVLGFGIVFAIMVGYCAYIYILVRLAFLLNPVVIAESRIDFQRSWSLSKGNFWRIFLILLSVFVPIMVVLFVALYFWYGGFPPIVPFNASPGQIAASNAATTAWMAAGMRRTLDYWFIISPISGLLTILMYGLGCGAQSFAYRALVPQTPSTPVTSN